MKIIQKLIITASLLVGDYTFACGKTKLEYEILPTCEVKILSVKEENGVSISQANLTEAKEWWRDYLQNAATTIFDKNNNVPPTARKIFRGGGSGTLYCEFGTNGTIVSAYTIPTWWVESEKKWVTRGKKQMSLVNDKLPKKELHKSEIESCS